MVTVEEDGTMMAVIRRTGKVAAWAAPGLIAGIGLPALGALVLLAILAAGVTCWVLGSKDRTDRFSRVLLAWRGNSSCLTPGISLLPSPPVPRPRRWPWPRRL